MPDDTATHLQKHKNTYILAGAIAASSTVTAVVTYAVVRGYVKPEVIAKAQNIALLQWRPISEVTVQVIRRGHPGYVVECLDTKEVFASIRRAAEVFDIHPSKLAKHLKNGSTAVINGHTFQIIGEAAGVVNDVVV